MTIDELLKLAREIYDSPPRLRSSVDVDAVSSAILSLLSVSPDCGWPEPQCKGPNAIWWESLGSAIDADEARAMAIALLRVADEAEARHG